MKTRIHFKLFFAMVFALFLASSSCSEGMMTKTGTDNSPRANIALDCSLAGNMAKAECVEKCIGNPENEWCKKAGGAVFDCPSEGSFKAVNPFTGEELQMPATTPSQENAETNDILAVKPFSAANFNTLLAGRGARLFIDVIGGEPSMNLGSPINSIDVFKSGEKYYAVAGTASGVKIVPFSHNPEKGFEIDEAGTAEFKQLGGVSQVAVAVSVDISASGNAANLPPGMWLSLNAPIGEGPRDAAGSNIDFAYLLDSGGNVWRIKLHHLLNGGCIEKLYSAEAGGQGEKLSAVKFGIAGQYLVLFANSADGNQQILILNLLASGTGSFKKLDRHLQEDGDIFATDLALLGNKLYVATHTKNGNAYLTVADADRPDAISSYLLPAPEGLNAVHSLNNKITAGPERIYLRGENKYFATAGVSSPETITAEILENGAAGSPWVTVFDRKNKEVITSTTGEIEIISGDNFENIRIQR